MNDLTIFTSPAFGDIRGVTIDGEPWLVGKDVAAALGYQNTKKALADHVDEEDKRQGDGVTIRDPMGREQKPTVINESGLYSLVLSSKLPTAKQFRRWVTSEVLPAIRRNGGYIAGQESLSDTEIMAKALLLARKTIAERAARISTLEAETKSLNEKIEADAPKVFFAESVSAANGGILIREAAKLLKQNGYNTGEKRLYQWLRDNGYLISARGRDYNLPTQRSMEMGLFVIKESTGTTLNGTHVNRTALLTGKGQLYFMNKLCPKQASVEA